MHELINDFAQHPIASFFACLFALGALQIAVQGIAYIINSLSNQNK